ncbi:MAG: HTTM domain-containing protein [Polyangiaceae bacterium]
MSPRSEHPVTLALLRIAVCAIVLVSPEVLRAPVHALLAPALRVAPEGLGWFVAFIPIGPRIAQVAQLGVALGAFAGLVGYRARLAMGAVAFFGFYTFALAQLTGAVTHDMHLVWFALVLAVSPCGDALTLFPEPSSGAGPSVYQRSLAYTWPLVAVRALFSCIYFFPGMWKLRSSGLGWATSDNLRNQMYTKWFQWGGWLPAFRIDEHPLLLEVSAFSVLAFELGFPFLMLSRRTRLLAALGGLAFHFSGDAFLRIRFPSLWVCYVALVDWGPLAERVRRASADAVTKTRLASRWPMRVGAILVAAAVVQGLRGETFAWPFACYPTFQWRVGTEMADLVLEAESADGAVVIIDSGGNGRGRPQDRWGLVWSLAGLSHGPPSRSALVSYWNGVDHARARGAVRGRVVRVNWSVLPSDRDRAPTMRRVLDTFALDPGTGAAL